MLKRIHYRLKAFLLLVTILFTASRSYATHIFGVDLYYTYVAGNTYTINLVMYGDCSGAAFGTFSSSAPVVNIYNGNTFVSSVTLAIQAPTSGVEVTPVCPADVGLTTCTNPAFTIPGVKKFVYKANVTLSGTSTVWRFLFQGVMGASSAGRSSSITNITSPGSTLIQLVDTLNNTTVNNSSAVYTTIPTPFFCISVPANFNPGAVDPNGDSLSFHLVPGVDANTGSNVNYILPYSATAPLAVSPGTFSFSTTTGQLSFTPNVVQRSLVVYNVEEFKAGVLVGTSQREMTVVVISPCTNTPPDGGITTPSAGTVTSPTTIDICGNVGAFNFHINPTDPDGDHITMTVAGLPAGSTFNIVGNGTFTPLGTFAWNTTGVAPGAYIFYVTYQDDGCPLSGKQTIAYTINILPLPTETFALVSAATCTKKAVFHVTPGGSASPWTIRMISGVTTLHTFTGVTGMITDSLVPGTYTIRITNPSGCFVDTIVTLVAPTLPVPTCTTSPPLCPGGATGSATISATGGLSPYLYAIGSGSYSSSGTFTGLTPGTYTLHIKDANDCIKDTIVTVPNATPILMNISITKPICDTYTNGRVIINAYNSVGPYTYSIGTGPFSSNDTFTHLGVGTYIFHVKNANGCIVDTPLTLVDSITVHATFSIANILCNGGTGTVTVTGTGGISPYAYAYNTNPFGTSNVFTLVAGAYTFHVRDVNFCPFDTAITLVQPTPITITPTISNVVCNSTATGSISVSALGGTPGYTYSMDGGAFVSSISFGGLFAGSHIIRVKDANGCIYADTVVITQPTAVVIDSVIMVKPTCNGYTNGTITVYSSGGVLSHTYAVGGGTYGTSHTFTGLGAGTYTMHVKDANGCIKDTIVTLQQPTAIVPGAGVVSSICQTLANGKVTLYASGGTPGYTYAVGSGAYGTSAVFTPLAAATYTFHVKDANGCIKDTIISVHDSLHVSGLFTITPTLCFNDSTGKIDVTGTGGTSPYVYAIGAGTFATIHLYTNLLAGSYIIHIKDNNGCQHDTAVSVTQPTPVTAGLTITPPSCNGYSDGSVAVFAAGGTPAYTYSWNGSAYSAVTTLGTLTAGSDSIKVKDANGCVYDTTFTVTEPTKLIISDLTVTNILCNGGSNGAVNVSASGATAPYMYAANSSAWQISSVFTGFSAGLVTIRVTDAHGCETDTSVTITEPPLLVINGLDTLNPTCFGFTDGAVTVHAAGGTPAYVYSDDNTTFNTPNAFTTLGAGTYTFSVKDVNGCRADTTITLTSMPPIFTNSISILQPKCYAGTDGTVSIVASGGVPQFTYNIGTTQTTTGIFTGLGSGQYVITITDSKNCTIDTIVHVPQPDSLVVTATVTPNECIGIDNKGSVSVTVTGGTEPYSYIWNNDPAKTYAGLAGLPNGLYAVSVTDANNCTDTLSAIVGYDNCCTPYIPNAFTPNGDGKNDYFKILFKGDMYIIIFSIYNRFGQRVYSISNTTDQTLAWDGKLDGVDAELGTYYYYAKIICGNKGNRVVELKGDITLIR